MWEQVRTHSEVLEELESLASNLRGVRASIVKDPLGHVDNRITLARVEECCRRAIKASQDPRVVNSDRKSDLRAALVRVQSEVRSLSFFVAHAKTLISAWLLRRSGMVDGYESDGRPVRPSNERETVQA